MTAGTDDLKSLIKRVKRTYSHPLPMSTHMVSCAEVIENRRRRLTFAGATRCRLGSVNEPGAVLCGAARAIRSIATKSTERASESRSKSLARAIPKMMNYPVLLQSILEVAMGTCGDLGSVALRRRVLDFLMLAGVLLGACNGVVP